MAGQNTNCVNCVARFRAMVSGIIRLSQARAYAWPFMAKSIAQQGPVVMGGSQRAAGRYEATKVAR